MRKKYGCKGIKAEYGDINELEKIRIYLEYNPEVFTNDFMEELADRFLNYNNVRRKIKELYPRIVREDIADNINLIPDDYEQVFKEKN
jgi:hypothetical protein